MAQIGYDRTPCPCPGAPALANRVRELLGLHAVAWTDDPQRGFDHGAYVPPVAMYPDANAPVLQISMPALDLCLGVRGRVWPPGRVA
jgi:4,5-DOPA dioxygenase extradiol